MNDNIEHLPPEYSSDELGIANISLDQLKLGLSNRFLDVPPLDVWVVKIVEVVQTDDPMAFPKQSPA